MKDSKLEKNKEIVRHFFELGNKKDTAARDKMYTDDAVLITTPRYLPFWSGPHDREEIRKLEEAVKTYPKFEMVIKTLTAEEDRVAVEVESFAETQEGKIYNNQYHFLITLRDGKIAKFQEFFDNIHAAIRLCGLGTDYDLDSEGNFIPRKK